MKNFGKTLLFSMLAIFILIIIWAVTAYNGLVSSKEAVNKAESAISSQLQRRSDLIPNLVNTVKGYTHHEAAVIKEISEARAKLAGAASANEKLNANTELSNAINRLLVVVENYPDLKADTTFNELTDELAGTENRINVARIDYNEEVSKYNQKVKSFPSSIFANIFGFTTANYFKIEESNKAVPTVDFNNK